MISDLTPEQIASLVRYPEDALTQDLPNLIFFNLDNPDNQTISWTDGLCVFGLKSHREPQNGGKWRRLADPTCVLKVVGRHMKKVIDREGDITTGLERALALEYLKAIEDGKDVVISEFCPYHAKVDDGVINMQRMLDRLLGTVRCNCELTKDDWVRTKQYATDNLDE